jgi:hypothetical protein
MAYTASGDFAAAVEAAAKAIQANPRFSLLHVLHAAALSRIDCVAEAQAAAARVQESPRTTKLYDRTGDEITLDEVERITI